MLGPWELHLYDWNGERIGELIDARKVEIQAGLNRERSLSFELPITGSGITEELIEAADAVITAEIETDFRFVAAERLNPYTGEKELKFVGPVLNATETASEGEIPMLNVSCIGPYWRAGKRIVQIGPHGRSAQGLSFEGEQGELAWRSIQSTNNEDGNSWLRALAADQAPSDTITIQNAGGHRTVADVISLATGIEWQVEPRLHLHGGTDLCLGHFKSAPLMGTDRTGTVSFDYACERKNASSVKRERTLEHFANRVTNANAGLDEAEYAITKQDSGSILRHGVFEEVAPFDMPDYELREKWVNLNLSLRKLPRRLYTITPERSDLTDGTRQGASVPIPLIDYEPGDLVRARAFYGGKQRWDVAVRVWDIRISVDENGAETAELGLFMS